VTICSGYSLTPTVGCSANFQGAGASAASSSTAPVQATARRLEKILGLDSAKGSGGNSAKAGADRKNTPVKTGGKDQKGNAEKPKAESPSQPAPAGKGTTGGDGLVDYLLGGAGQ
jgi:hypothetical protein